MSYNEKPAPAGIAPDPPISITKEEWLTRLESLHFKQIDMNKLIMNYLVTGKFFRFFFFSFLFCY